MWARYGVSRILYDFDVYLGKQPDTDTCRKYGKSRAVVLKLVEALPKNVGHKFYIDNLFLSISLFNYMKELGIWAVGTIRNNQLYSEYNLNQKELQKKGRGSLDYLGDANSNVTIVHWIDNSIIKERHCQQKNLSRSNIMQFLEFQTRIANSLLF